MVGGRYYGKMCPIEACRKINGSAMNTIICSKFPPRQLLHCLIGRYTSDSVDPCLLTNGTNAYICGQA